MKTIEFDATLIFRNCLHGKKRKPEILVKTCQNIDFDKDSSLEIAEKLVRKAIEIYKVRKKVYGS